MFDIKTLLNEMVDPILQFPDIWIRTHTHPPEILQVLLLFDLLQSQIIDEIAHTVDVVRKDNAADGFNKDQTESLLPVGCHIVPEAHSQHDIDAPVIPENVFDVPRLIHDVLYLPPGVLRDEAH